MREIAAALLIAVAAAAFAAPMKIGGVQNETGDVDITCLGKYIFAEPVVVVLSPSKETVPDTNAVYAVECRIVYRDKENPPPTTRRGFPRYGLVCSFLNECLQGYVRQEYSGWDFTALLEDYRSGNFVSRLQGKSFSEYVEKCAEQYKLANPKFRFGVEIDAVTTRSISDFAAALRQLDEQERAAAQAAAEPAVPADSADAAQVPATPAETLAE